MLSAVSTSDLNLDLCAHEPIRLPGSIQPHGAFVVADRDSRCSTVLEAPPRIAAVTRTEKK